MSSGVLWKKDHVPTDLRLSAKMVGHMQNGFFLFTSSTVLPEQNLGWFLGDTALNRPRVQQTIWSLSFPPTPKLETSPAASIQLKTFSPLRPVVLGDLHVSSVRRTEKDRHEEGKLGLKSSFSSIQPAMQLAARRGRALYLLKGTHCPLPKPVPVGGPPHPEGLSFFPLHPARCLISNTHFEALLQSKVSFCWQIGIAEF